MLSKIILSATFLFSVFTAHAQSDTGQEINTKMLKVSNNIYMLEGKGGNIGLSFGDDGIFMIDDQYAEGVEQIQNDIKKISDKPVRFLINTHFHGDHTGGNVAMAETGTVIFSHENVRSRLQDIMETEKKKTPKESLPVITFSDDLTFYFNGEKIYVFHVHNAHTDGDAMVYFTKSNVLHAGDVFFNGKYPFIDTNNGGSIKGYMSAINKALLVINEDTKIIPGHGNIASYSDFKDFQEMLSISYRKVAKKYLVSKTEAEVLADTSLTQMYDDKGYGDGFINRERFLKMLYAEFAKENAGSESNNEKNTKAREKIEEMKKKHAAKGKN